MNDLLSHLASQGIQGDTALELCERKKSNKNLSGVILQGKWISLSPPANSDSQRFNEMVESGIPPQANTDREFLEGHCNGSQFQKRPQDGEAYKKVADQAGVSITGKVYKSSLARYPGDPEAWVSGRGDVQRICEARGLGCDGSVKVQKREKDVEPSPSVGVAEHLVSEAVLAQTEGKGLSAREVRDVREKTRDRLTPHWKKKSSKKSGRR
jgi:hypothetical protein